MHRRDFIVNSCTACIGATGVGVLLASCRSTRYITGDLGKDGLVVRTEEFKRIKNGKATYRSFLVIRNDALQYPICLYRFNEEEYTALWMRCTHQGTELQASGEYLQCPAHGSEFNHEGNVTNGPADDNLRKFPVVVSNNEIFIDLRKS